MKEEIRFNEKYNCYISNMGYIIRETGQVSYPTCRKDTGYYVIRDGNGKVKRIHRMVAETFLGEPEQRLDVNHKDGDKSNNRADNLEWVTRSENLYHAYQSGLRSQKRGEENHAAKLTVAQAQEIYDRYETDGYHSNTTELAKEFGLAPGTVRKIVKGEKKGKEYWPEVVRNRTFPENRRGGVAIREKVEKEKIICFCDGTSKRVAQIDPETDEVLRVYDSVSQALRETGITNIGNAANGRHETAGGYKWKFL